MHISRIRILTMVKRCAPQQRTSAPLWFIIRRKFSRKYDASLAEIEQALAIQSEAERKNKRS